MTLQEGLSFLPGNKFFSVSYFWLCWAFFAAPWLFVTVQGLSRGAWSSHCGGFSGCEARALGFSSCGAQA